MSDEYFQRSTFARPSHRLMPLTGSDTKRNERRGSRQENKVDNLNLDGLGLIEARQLVMQQIASQQRRRGMLWTDQQRRASDAALNLALSDPSQEGHDGLVESYRRVGAERLAERMGKSVDYLLSYWKQTEAKYPKNARYHGHS
jgi:hypothetical protein